MATNLYYPLNKEPSTPYDIWTYSDLSNHLISSLQGKKEENVWIRPMGQLCHLVGKDRHWCPIDGAYSYTIRDPITTIRSNGKATVSSFSMYNLRNNPPVPPRSKIDLGPVLFEKKNITFTNGPFTLRGTPLPFSNQYTFSKIPSFRTY
jgi:hypothetical protein